MALLSFLPPCIGAETQQTEVVISEPSRWRVDTGIAFNISLEQVKDDNGASGGRLFQSVQYGFFGMTTYRLLSWFEAGLFTHVERGVRSAANLGPNDASGAPTIVDKVGGSYTQFWIGPTVRAFWKTLFLELSYIAYGIRWDSARSDIPNTSGDGASTFRISPSVAYLITFGGGVPITDTLQAVLRLEYRILYYDRRGVQSCRGFSLRNSEHSPSGGVSLDVLDTIVRDSIWRACG